MVKQPSSGIVTIGVPLGIYASYDHREIKDLFVKELNKVNGGNKIIAPNEKIINLPIRLPYKDVRRIRLLAEENNVTILELTTSIIKGATLNG